MRFQFEFRTDEWLVTAQVAIAGDARRASKEGRRRHRRVAGGRTASKSETRLRRRHAGGVPAADTPIGEPRFGRWYVGIALCKDTPTSANASRRARFGWRRQRMLSCVRTQRRRRRRASFCLAGVEVRHHRPIPAAEIGRRAEKGRAALGRDVVAGTPQGAAERRVPRRPRGVFFFRGALVATPLRNTRVPGRGVAATLVSAGYLFCSRGVAATLASAGRPRRESASARLPSNAARLVSTEHPRRRRGVAATHLRVARPASKTKKPQARARARAWVS